MSWFSFVLFCIICHMVDVVWQRSGMCALHSLLTSFVSCLFFFFSSSRTTYKMLKMWKFWSWLKKTCCHFIHHVTLRYVCGNDWLSTLWSYCPSYPTLNYPTITMVNWSVLKNWWDIMHKLDHCLSYYFSHNSPSIFNSQDLCTYVYVNSM